MYQVYQICVLVFSFCTKYIICTNEIQGGIRMKTAIVFYSKHHGNTKKLIDAICNASNDEISLIDVTTIDKANLNDYDLIGFASGIYYSSFQKRVLEFAKNNLPSGKKCFLLYTYGAEKQGYTKSITKIITDKNCTVLNEYGCLGFNTFGPFKLIGGIAKKHPTADELENAIHFYEKLK